MNAPAHAAFSLCRTPAAASLPLNIAPGILQARKSLAAIPFVAAVFQESLLNFFSEKFTFSHCLYLSFIGPVESGIPHFDGRQK